jgi:hypothetical protein
MKNRTIKSLSMILALVPIAAFAALPSSTATQVALAESDGESGHIYVVTFTKWVLPDTPPPDVLALMGGAVGGDAGFGAFAGEGLQDNIDEATGIENAVVDYHINGAKHSFTARLNVTQYGQDIGDRAAITGVVTDGWLKGENVVGTYTVKSCPTKPPLLQCFKGRLYIHVGAKD